MGVSSKVVNSRSFQGAVTRRGTVVARQRFLMRWSSILSVSLATAVASGAWLGCSSEPDSGGSATEAIVEGDCTIFSVRDQADIPLKNLNQKDPVVKKI